jgi:hypothetical protein
MQHGRLRAIAIVFASFSFAPAALAQQKTIQPQKWEYKITSSCEPRDRGTDIQQLGEEGWELVAMDASNCVLRYFKRPKGAEPKRTMRQQQTAPQCSIPLDKAPTIRGLHLGMSADELLSLFALKNQSKFQAETALKNASSAPNYGLADFTLSLSDANMTETKEKFAGIRYFRFKSVDGRVVEINVDYEANPLLYPSWTINEWTAKVSNTYSLPGLNNWESSPSDNQRKLRCKELEIEAAIGQSVYPPLPGLGPYQWPRLTITNPSYRKVIEQRAKSDQEKKQREFVL